MASSVSKTSTGGAARPAVKPKPKPDRRPVVPRKPPVRNPKRDPRDHPWRRKKPEPKRQPKSPRIPKRKGTPFGRRPVFKPGTPVRFRKWPFNPPSLDRYAGAVGGGLAGLAIGYILTQDMPDLASQGWCLSCSVPGNLDVYTFNGSQNVGVTPCKNPSLLCGVSGQPYGGFWPAALPAAAPGQQTGQRLLIGQQDVNPARATWKQVWFRPNRPGNPQWGPTVLPPLRPVPKVIPLDAPVAPPQWWAPPLPFANEPVPDAPPVKPRPRPRPQPREVPLRYPLGVVPSVDLDNSGRGVSGTPGKHEQKPPDHKTRERKKAIKGSQATKWLQFLAKTGGKFTEIDDFVSAIYRSMPWQLRRWRGRDGVWRERHWTTAQRAQAIYEMLGEVDINKALNNLATNELLDRGLAKLSQAVREKALSQGYSYPTSGYVPSKMTEHGESWWEIRKAAEQAEFQAWWNKQYAPGTTYDGRPRYSRARWILKRVQNPKTGEWETVRVERPTTQIPWYRQVSNYSSRIPVFDKAGRIVAWKLVPGTYYG